jgi:hypothetical protein
MDRTASPDAYRPAYGVEFDFESEPVGVFRDLAPPTLPGEYAYEPYRSGGHYRMGIALDRGEEVTCKYMLDDKRVSFRVLSHSDYGILNLQEFSIEPPMSVELIRLTQILDDIYAMTFRDALGEHEIQTRWFKDGVREALVDHGSLSLHSFLESRYPLKVDKLNGIVRSYRSTEAPALPLRLV